MIKDLIKELYFIGVNVNDEKSYDFNLIKLLIDKHRYSCKLTVKNKFVDEIFNLRTHYMSRYDDPVLGSSLSHDIEMSDIFGDVLIIRKFSDTRSTLFYHKQTDDFNRTSPCPF